MCKKIIDYDIVTYMYLEFRYVCQEKHRHYIVMFKFNCIGEHSTGRRAWWFLVGLGVNDTSKILGLDQHMKLEFLILSEAN